MSTRGYPISATYANTDTLNSITAPTASVSMNSLKITSLSNGSSSGDATSFAQLQSLVSGLGYKRIRTSVVYAGDLSASSFTLSGFITAATWLNTDGVVKITCTHPDPGFNYLVLAIQYSPRQDTNDNDNNS